MDLPIDILNKIIRLIYINKDAISFLSIKTIYHKSKPKIKFRENVYYNPRLEKLPYYNKLRVSFFANFFDINPIPKGIYRLRYNIQGSLYPGEIPNSVQILSFHSLFNVPLKVGDIPNSVKELWFSSTFNHTIIPNVIPYSVKKVHFGNIYNQPILPGSIPDSVKILEFGESFIQPLSKKNLPKNLETLVLGHDYRDLLNLKELPETIKKLVIKWPGDHYYC